MKSDLPYLLALSQFNGLGPRTLKKILAVFSSPEACFKASFLDLKNAGLSEQAADDFIKQAKLANPEKLVEQLIKENIQATTVFNQDYPALLKEIYDPPIVLYWRGDLTVSLRDLLLAVVGSRKISNYGQAIMPQLLTEVIKQKVVIVSGLAHGVDSLAHQLALENGGETIAVVGSGLAWDYFYPTSQRRLAEKILEQGGLIISEFPPCTLAMPYNFPRRNRIISGLAQAALVIEAWQKSGALITAKFALDQGREVLAVPGPINSPTSLGPNNLIQNGARAITSANDILESLGVMISEKNQTQPLPTQLTTEELIILKILKNANLHIDKIVENCNLETSLVNGLLIQMELKGWIKNAGGQNYTSLITL